MVCFGFITDFGPAPAQSKSVLSQHNILKVRWALRWLRCKVIYVLKRAKISPKAYNLHKSKYFNNGVTDFIFQLWDVRTIIPLHRSHLRAHRTLRMLCCDKTLLDSNGKLKVLLLFFCDFKHKMQQRVKSAHKKWFFIYLKTPLQNVF